MAVYWGKKLSELKKVLSDHPSKALSFVLPDGDVIPAHYHITEVGYISKRFIDCGGTQRSVSACQLQVWLGNDEQHRLSSGKAAEILELGKSVLPAEDLDVEIEYEDCSISQYAVSTGQVKDDAVTLELASKHTDCLAKEACGIGSAPGAEASCCGTEGGCC